MVCVPLGATLPSPYGEDRLAARIYPVLEESTHTLHSACLGPICHWWDSDPHTGATSQPLVCPRSHTSIAPATRTKKHTKNSGAPFADWCCDLFPRMSLIYLLYRFSCSPQGRRRLQSGRSRSRSFAGSSSCRAGASRANEQVPDWSP